MGACTSASAGDVHAALQVDTRSRLGSDASARVCKPRTGAKRLCAVSTTLPTAQNDGSQRSLGGFSVSTASVSPLETTQAPSTLNDLAVNGSTPAVNDLAVNASTTTSARVPNIHAFGRDTDSNGARRGSRRSVVSVLSAHSCDSEGTAASISAVGFRSEDVGGRGLEPSTLVPFHWAKGEQLGAGTQGTVYLALNQQDGGLMAVKEIDIATVHASNRRGKDAAVRLVQQLEILSSLHHPNIVRYLHTEIDDRCLYIFTEWISGGSLRRVVRKFGLLAPRVVRMYTQGILRGLEYLHANNVVHRDIKSANILVDQDGVAKLADFGCSTHASNDIQAKVVGTPYFMAPELLTERTIAPPIDIWALGCTVIEMMTGQPPWKDHGFTSARALVQHIIHTREPPTYPAAASPALRDFLDRCFERDASKRASAADLLTHAFLAPSV